MYLTVNFIDNLNLGFDLKSLSFVTLLHVAPVVENRLFLNTQRPCFCNLVPLDFRN
ncbi:hypothetical protein FQR65_LT09196 [Abscondita terminalis]|nr:hypothetical protein FQR65_LT09196 [Abscondita terminalis]